MMPIWLAVLLAILQSLLSGIVLMFLKRSTEQRDQRLEKIDNSILRLADKIDVQNGRVKILEQWKHDHDDWAKRESTRLENKLEKMDDNAREITVTNPPRRRKRSRKT